MAGFGTVNKTETQYSFGGQYLVSVDGVYIKDHLGDVVGVLIGEFQDLEQAYNGVCDERDEFKGMLIDNGIIEKEYTPEELIEIERQKDREKIDELTKAVSALIEKSQKDSELIEKLTQQSNPDPQVAINNSQVKPSSQNSYNGNKKGGNN